METRTIMEVSMEGQLLDSFLLNVTEGQFVPYEKLSAVCGRKVTNDGRGILNSSRSRLRRDQGIVFSVIRSKGIKRLTESEIANLGPSHTKRIRRATYRGLQELSCVREFDKLSDADKNAHTTSASQLGMIGLASKISSTKRIRSAVERSSGKLEIAETLALFNGEAKK